MPRTAHFQAALNSLTATFIDSDACGTGGPASCSWGFYDNFTTGSKNTYIGLSSSLWSNGGFQFYSSFAQSLNASLMGPGQPSPIKQISIAPSTDDTAAMALIAVLAHEMGHIKWWKNAISAINNGAQTCQVDGSYQLFAKIGWVNHDAHARNWQPFGTERRYNGRSGSGNSPRGGKDKDAIAGDLNNPGALNSDLTTVFNGEWASIFATVTPDEDFVETYTLMTLLNAMNRASPVTSFKIFSPAVSPQT
jgi:hypothetical protein